MKYKLETIPVWDALKEDSECPLCFLEQKMTDYYTGYYLGSSVMNPETRVVVNKKGFCPNHFQGLLDYRKAHALGLMTHTYMGETVKGIMPLLSHLQKKGSKTRERGGGGNRKAMLKSAEQLIEQLRSKEKSCLICEGIERTMKRYAFTIAYLWKDDQEFRTAFKESRGICLHHLPLQLELGEEGLKDKDLGDFMEALASTEIKALERLNEELLWFTQKFDSQNNDKEWGSSVDAHRRSIQKLAGPVKE